ncbi:Long-chain-fatty-acid--CoA ligase FadD15 [Kordia antarctica]|uniref:Long-chain-fatty-acid--CoA ligase FadD15 n=1 Tax=Kordia antarctica TaxID=1218801 RepID=A0A7L4ZH65_9FLAO|nr:AMP-binding protein [Kordia antarctica]QHI35945.1 Long-chain-fatty-acid--CoA ligase FadD15 [Kordia antarctica]
MNTSEITQQSYPSNFNLTEDKMNNLITILKTSSKGRLEYFKDGKTHTKAFSDLYEDIKKTVLFFHQKDIQPGDRLGIIGENSLEWVIIDLACIAYGLITVPLDPVAEHNLDEAITAYQLKHTLTDDSKYINHPSVSAFSEIYSISNKTHNLKSLKQYDINDILTYKFTSGSTQLPKMIGVQRKSVDAVLKAIQSLFNHNEQDKILVFLPLHAYQMRYWLYSAILYDFTLLLAPKRHIFYALSELKPTVVMGVPHFYETLMKMFLEEVDNPKNITTQDEQLFQDLTGGFIRYLWTGSAPIHPQTLQFYFDRKTPLFQGYGMNETCIVSKNYAGFNKIGSVGKPLPHIHIKISDVGELLVKNKFEVNTTYEICKPGDNEATFIENGYVATGDLGHIDEDGYLYITGRKKELIVLSNSKKIHPNTVEKWMTTSPYIKQCMIIGDHQPYIAALIYTENSLDRQIISEEILRLNETLKPEERIIKFELIDEIFSQENGLLTSQKKLKRKAISLQYQSLIETLF